MILFRCSGGKNPVAMRRVADNELDAHLGGMHVQNGILPVDTPNLDSI